MLKVTVLFLMIFLFAKTQAQNYQISFSGTGASTTVDSVKVENLTQCTKLILSGSKILHLTATVGINEMSAGSTTGKMNNLKSSKSLIEMQYTTGNRLKLTGFSEGIYRTICMLVPASTQTVTFNFIACTDTDNNHYSVVRIGKQVWMAENLKTTHYANGTAIPYVTGSKNWSALNDSCKAYCWYNNADSNKAIYGALYNWAAAMNGITKSSANPGKVQGVCPAGWHLPCDDEWWALTFCLGGENVAGSKLKENCSKLWKGPNLGATIERGLTAEGEIVVKTNYNTGSATNESGFTALPGGYREYNGMFGSIGYSGTWWSSTQYDTKTVWTQIMNTDYSYVISGDSAQTVPVIPRQAVPHFPR